MSAYQRNKGRRGEQQTVNLFKAAGIPAKRISMMESGGIDKGDIELEGGYAFQVKVGAQVPVFFERALDGYTGLVTHRDKSEWLVTMPLQDFCALWKDAQPERKIREAWGNLADEEEAND